MDYELLDSGQGQKFERFGKIRLIRPASQALWDPQLSVKEWEKADASFSRQGGMQWQINTKVPQSWVVEIAGIRFKLKRTDFGHVGIFPEQKAQWEWIQKVVRPGAKVLNLFAYSGGSTLAAAKAGGEVTHLDAAKGMIDWARENAELNGITHVRWLCDDASKFLARAMRRGEKYDAIILDPPSFGRGKGGEIFKIEHAMLQLLRDAMKLLSEKPLFFLLTSHTPGFTPIILSQLIEEGLPKGRLESGEMVLEGSESVFKLPNGSFARWSK